MPVTPASASRADDRSPPTSSSPSASSTATPRSRARSPTRCRWPRTCCTTSSSRATSPTSRSSTTCSPTRASSRRRSWWTACSTTARRSCAAGAWSAWCPRPICQTTASSTKLARAGIGMLWVHCSRITSAKSACASSSSGRPGPRQFVQPPRSIARQIASVNSFTAESSCSIGTTRFTRPACIARSARRTAARATWTR